MSDHPDFNEANLRSAVLPFTLIQNHSCTYVLYLYTYCLALLYAFFFIKYTLFSMYMSRFPILHAFNSSTLHTQARLVTWKCAGVFLWFYAMFHPDMVLACTYIFWKLSFLETSFKVCFTTRTFFIWLFIKVIRRGLVVIFSFLFGEEHCLFV